MYGRREAALPVEFQSLSGKVNYVQQRGLQEWSSSCPNCGGSQHRDGGWPDRFRMFRGGGRTGKPRGWCRKCNYKWFPDSQTNPDYEKLQQYYAEELRKQEEYRQATEARIDDIRKSQRWLEYHRQLDEYGRNWWLRNGVPVEWQKFWSLGYVPDRPFEFNGDITHGSAFTIPKFDLNWQLTNIDFRLVDPPEGAGKYRPLAGIPASAFFSRPDEKELSDEIIVVEGSKKAMVVALRSKKGESRQVIGIPGCKSWCGMEARLKECGRVWVIFDPDAQAAAKDFCKAIGPNAWRVTLPMKPDDAFMTGMTIREFAAALRNARGI